MYSNFSQIQLAASPASILGLTGYTSYPFVLMYLARMRSFLLRSYTITKRNQEVMMVLTRVDFGDEGRFPFNPKFQKFRLVHHMERTISVWSDRNIRDQL